MKMNDRMYGQIHILTTDYIKFSFNKMKKNKTEEDQKRITEYIREWEFQPQTRIRKSIQRHIYLQAIVDLHIVYLETQLIILSKIHTPNLKNLSLYLEYFIEEAAIKKISISLSHLESLNLVNMNQNIRCFNQIQYTKIINSNLKRIKKVDMSSFHITKQLQLFVASGFPKISSLILKNCHLNIGSIRTILNNMKLLVFLDLSYNEELDDECCAVISVCASLKTLRIQNTLVSDKGLFTLLKLKFLKQFYLSQTLISLSGISRTIRKKKNTIESISIKDCKHLSNQRRVLKKISLLCPTVLQF